MKEKLTIENFGGIENSTFEFKAINILIGPQASGKSVTVKLVYFFRSFFDEAYNSALRRESKEDLFAIQKRFFYSYFPSETWGPFPFRITYQIGDLELKVEETQSGIAFSHSEELDSFLSLVQKLVSTHSLDVFSARDIISGTDDTRSMFLELTANTIGLQAPFNPYFIPAGRSFFANIQSSIYNFLRELRRLDPFLVEFGAVYEKVKGMTESLPDGHPFQDFDRLGAEVLSGKYLREADKDFIVHKDERKVNLANASSGQQETLPLLLVLRELSISASYNPAQAMVEKGATLYIEEPEAHLFPIAQKRIVQLLSRTFNSKPNGFQYFITTHSPYILSSFNNLIEAGIIKNENPHLQSRLEKIVPAEEILPPESIAAFGLDAGEVTDLIDPETGLIGENLLDQVSEEISIQFGDLLDLAY